MADPSNADARRVAGAEAFLRRALSHSKGPLPSDDVIRQQAIKLSRQMDKMVGRSPAALEEGRGS